MKKIFLILPVALLVLFESCKSDFSINAPVQNVYVLNCILRNDKSIQYAIVSKNIYTESGAPPTQNDADQNIRGVNIKIFDYRTEYVMRDTTIQLSDSGNVTRVNCYYANNVALIPDRDISIEATLPDGTTLKSTTHVPKISYANFSNYFPEVYSPGYLIRPSYSWSWVDASAPILDLPKLNVYYQKYENGAFADKEMSVPLAFYFTFDESGSLVPVPVNLSLNTFCMTTLETVNKTMQKISGDDPDKSSYIINKVVFSVGGLGPNLSKYYSAYKTYSTAFTIKLRQTDFSNIDGGKGIFGVYYKSSKTLTVDSLYIRSFGYKYKPQ